MKQFPLNKLALPILLTLPLAASSTTLGEGLQLKPTEKGTMIVGDDKTLQTLTTLPQTVMAAATGAGTDSSSGSGDVIIDNDKTLDLQANGKDVVVTGNRNTIHVHGDIPKLALIGRNNVVEVDRVGAIALVGAQNQVSYLGGLNSDQPNIDRVGANNTVTVREAQVQPSATASAAGQNLAISGSNQERTETVNAAQFTVSGSNNQLTLKGRIEELVITGSNNDIKAENLGHVTFTGSNNLVEYSNPIEATVSSDVRSGTNNDVRRR